MILERIWAREGRLLPIEKLHAPTVSVLAIMTFSMVVVASAGLALASAASLVASGAEHRYVIEIPAAQSGELPAALAAARGAPGVRSAIAVPESEMRKTLERWLGNAASSRDLPIPVLVTLDLGPSADPGAIDASVKARVPGSRMMSEGSELSPLLQSLRALQWVAVSLVLLMAVAMAAAIILAARAALDTHRSTIEIMHGIGATDSQITRLFERKIAVDAIAGAAGGAAAAAMVLLIIGASGAALAGELTASAPIEPGDLIVLALIPAAAVVVAVAVAHWTLLRALRDTL